MMTGKKCRKILQEHGNHNFDDKSDEWMQGFINYLYQLAGCKSLKDITLVLRSIKKAAYHLGIPTVVDPSSLSKANEIRDYRIFEELGMWLIRKVRP